jgi:hypothetical protein
MSTTPQHAPGAERPAAPKRSLRQRSRTGGLLALGVLAIVFSTKSRFTGSSARVTLR